MWETSILHNENRQKFLAQMFFRSDKYVETTPMRFVSYMSFWMDLENVNAINLFQDKQNCQGP